MGIYTSPYETRIVKQGPDMYEMHSSVANIILTRMNSNDFDYMIECLTKMRESIERCEYTFPKLVVDIENEKYDYFAFKNET